MQLGLEGALRYSFATNFIEEGEKEIYFTSCVS
jgi:hypothetical protein